ncbi:MAG TPA: hypothetical protein VNP92_21750 [Actinophytocola sp.]|nr:hypothetical protein [Actinophytocola sp.]
MNGKQQRRCHVRGHAAGEVLDQYGSWRPGEELPRRPVKVRNELDSRPNGQVSSPEDAFDQPGEDTVVFR